MLLVKRQWFYLIIFNLVVQLSFLNLNRHSISQRLPIQIQWNGQFTTIPNDNLPLIHANALLILLTLCVIFSWQSTKLLSHNWRLTSWHLNILISTSLKLTTILLCSYTWIFEAKLFNQSNQQLTQWINAGYLLSLILIGGRWCYQLKKDCHH